MGGGYRPRHKQTTGIIGSSLKRRAGLFVPLLYEEGSISGPMFIRQFMRGRRPADSLTFLAAANADRSQGVRFWRAMKMD